MKYSNYRVTYCRKCGNRVSPKPTKVHACKLASPGEPVKLTYFTRNELLAAQAERLAELQSGSR